ncbi:unnamed protein product [Brachionus calyciflorus]|uniref:Uncharacterized protein n=1 Tax=Brachionus calyciflorus TaxID=104777 RepID=A0A813M9H8_9BILA|nr:unnamed protein product [Brachionus calyciflorus]
MEKNTLSESHSKTFDKMEEKKLKRIKLSIVIFTIVNLAILIGYLVISLTVLTKHECSDNVKPLFNGDNHKILNSDKQIIHDLLTRDMFVYDSSKNRILSGKIGMNLVLDDYKEITTKEGENKNDYRIWFNATSRAANLILDVTTSKKSGSITCQTYDWTINQKPDTNYANQEFEDCFNLGDSYWYGQAENKNQQFWPINNIEFKEYTPYLTGLFGDNWSSILERYWLSSNGVAIIVNQTIPLFVKKNRTSFCLLASSKEPYHNQHFITKLKYDICKIDKTNVKDSYLNKLQLFVINNYFSKPSGIPDERMFKSPIWSTWANFKKKINESTIKMFAHEILANNYTHSQLEIDDKWQVSYGDFSFDTQKFPNMASLIEYLNSFDFRTTLWVHPFANIDSPNFLFQAFNFLEVRAPDGLRPAFTSWWDGLAAIILDTTNPNATNWFYSELEKIRQTTGIDSFKFDAGEVNWLPKRFWLNDGSITPDQYSMGYARMASRLGRMIEVRTGCQTQDLPIFVRMLDKDSTWGYDNGLKSVVTTGLVMSILGYPFILPDMIGGNAYIFNGEDIDFDSELIAYPDYQLYIRWAQLTAFLPSMQFSIPPWNYNNKTKVPVNQICRELVNLHERLVYPVLIEYAKNAVETGEPVIRPVWWIDNSDEKTLTISDQFLVGNDILVAPILDENQYKRDIYLPRGEWIAENGTSFKGPLVLKSYQAPIEVIPMSCHFTQKVRPPTGSRLLMLFSDNLSNIYSIFEYEETYIIIYDPMTPVRSCSGKYSGGIPFLKELNEEEFLELKTAFENLARKKENHTFDRSRPTGLFTSRNDKFIVRMGYYDEFERLVKKHQQDYVNSLQFEIQEMVEMVDCD